MHVYLTINNSSRLKNVTITPEAFIKAPPTRIIIKFTVSASPRKSLSAMDNEENKVLQ